MKNSNLKMPTRNIPENVAYRVSKGRGVRAHIWPKLFDVVALLDVPVNEAITYVIIDWHNQNIAKGETTNER